MALRIHILVPACTLLFLSAESQKISKADKISLANLQTHLQTLCADTAGGRGMDAPGEKTTGDYIISELSKAGVRPKGDNNGWLQTFTIDEGRQIGADALLSVDDHTLSTGKEWFPLTICPAGQVTGSPAIALPESGVPWFQDLKEWLETAATNPGFDLIGAIRAKSAACAKKGATALILYNSSGRYPDKLSFNPKDKPEPVTIPVLYITREAKRKYLRDESASVDIHIRISYTEQHLTGHNIVGLIDNSAATTVIIASRYDNNGGNAAMLELARLLAASKLRSNNYLFAVFSGNGTPGSAWFAAHPETDLRNVNYLLDLDRIGSVNDTTHALTLGGYNSSPAWPTLCGSIKDRKFFSFRYDTSASASGDQLAFRKDKIPVLAFSTATDARAAKPADPSGSPGELQVLKFVYALMEAANSHGRLEFAP